MEIRLAHISLNTALLLVCGSFYEEMKNVVVFSAFLRRKVALDILVCQVTEGSLSRSDNFAKGKIYFKIVPKVRP